MSKNQKRLCFVNGTNPKFLGGISLYQKNLINALEKNNEIHSTWVYQSYKQERYSKGNVEYIGLKCGKIPFINDVIFNIRVKRYLDNNYFDLINSHAIWGIWMAGYKKRKNQKIIHTYHGATYPYYKIHLKRFNIIKRILLSPLLLYGFLIEKPPIKKADKIICVSEKVKEQIEKTYPRKKDINVIRTGVDLNEFKPRKKGEIRKKLNLDPDKIYGLYVGKGGYWIKGLDRAVNLSEEIYKEDKNYRMIVIGADKNKVGSLIDKKFVTYLNKVPREDMSYYYNASDFIFCLSRYEGGAPTLVVSEGMASGCPIICSKDSEQEILNDGENSIIVSSFNNKEAKRILNTINNVKKIKKMVNNSLKTIKELSLDKWGKRYISVLIK